MIVFVMVVTLWTSGVSYVGGQPQEVEMFRTAEAAAIKAWEMEDGAGVFDHYSFKLYRAVLGDTLAVEEIPIPKVTVGGATKGGDG